MGRHVQVAICGRDICFDIDRVFYKQLTMAGSVCYTADTWARMFELFADGRVALADLAFAPVTAHLTGRPRSSL